MWDKSLAPLPQGVTNTVVLRLHRVRLKLVSGSVFFPVCSAPLTSLILTAFPNQSLEQESTGSGSASREPYRDWHDCTVATNSTDMEMSSCLWDNLSEALPSRDSPCYVARNQLSLIFSLGRKLAAAFQVIFLVDGKKHCWDSVKHTAIIMLDILGYKSKNGPEEYTHAPWLWNKLPRSWLHKINVFSHSFGLQVSKLVSLWWNQGIYQQ